MSDYEYNKGKLIPVPVISIEEFARTFISDQQLADSGYKDKLSLFEDNSEDAGYVILDKKLYRVEFEVRRGEMMTDFCKLTHREDGSINFESQHYNGGAHWTEVVEDALEKHDANS